MLTCNVWYSAPSLWMGGGPDSHSDSQDHHPSTNCENHMLQLNLLTPNVNYSGRTAPLTSKVAFHIFIQQI